MKKVKIKKFGACNYAAFTKPIEVNLEDRNSKLIWITGPNGIGKTSIFDIPCFTFYGTTSKGLKSDSLVNRRTKKNLETYVEFDIEENGITNSYKCSRYYSHSDFGDNAILLKNGEEISKSLSEVKRTIENLLIPEKLFTNTVLFGQKVNTFFTDLPDSKKKEIFKLVLQTDYYDEWYKESDKRLKDKSVDVSKLEEEVNLDKRMLDKFKQDLNILKSDFDNFEKEKKIEISKLEIKISELKSEDDAISSDQSMIEELRKEIENLKLSINEKENCIKNIKSKIESNISNILKNAADKELELSKLKNSKILDVNEKEKNELKKFDEKISEIEIGYNNEKLKNKDKISIQDNQKSSILTEMKMLEKDIDEISHRLFSNNQSSCPTCLRELDDKSRREVENKVEIKHARINTLREEHKKCNEEIQKLSNEFSDISKKYNLSKTEINKEKEKISYNYNEEKYEIESKYENALNILATRKTEMIKKENDSIEDEISLNQNDVQNFKNEIDTKTKKLNNLLMNLEYKNDLKSKVFSFKKLIEEKKNNQFPNYSERKESIENNIGITELKISDYCENISKTKKEIDILNFWKIAFSPSGIPNMLIDESIPFVNERLFYYLNEISQGRYCVSLDTQKEVGKELKDKININVLDTENLSDDRKQFSGGQTRMVDIAMILSLCDLQSSIQNISFNLLLFDEIFDSLDSENTSNVFRLLKNISKEKTILLISHKDLDVMQEDDVIRL